MGAALGLIVLAWPIAAAAQGHMLEACSRGRIDICRNILDRPRLAPGTRAAIEFLLTQIETEEKACAGGDTDACEALLRRYPDLPPATGPGPVPRR